jgi:hypothetical protein
MRHPDQVHHEVHVSPGGFCNDPRVAFIAFIALGVSTDEREEAAETVRLHA